MMIYLALLRRVKHYLFFSYLELKRRYRIISGRSLIYVFGDSHSLLLQHEIFKIHHVGPATAFNLFSDKSTVQGRQKIYKAINKLSKKKKNIFLFIFGEIDCRIHINKASKNLSTSIDQAILNTVKSYLKFLKEINSNFPDNRILVLNVLPSGEQENIYKTKYYPSRKAQLEIVRKFNKTLEIFCQKNNFIYLSIFDDLLDERGERVKKYIFDSVHYNKKIVPFVIQEMKRKEVL